MRRRLSLLLALLLLAPLSFARTRAVRVTTPLQIPSADAIAAQAIGRGVPGVVIGVRKGNATFTKAWGDFDVESHVPEQPGTVHQIASVSKQFTAAAILRLVEQGKVKLDDRASLWIPELDARFDGVTLERLMSHTSGLLEFSETLGDLYSPKSQQQLLAAVRPPFFNPGARFFYSNMGYSLLAMVIERASNQTYEQFLRDQFFVPFGLEDTTICGQTAPVPVGYEPGSPRRRARPYDMSIFFGSGSLCSTALDLLDWNHARVSGMAVSAESYSTMSTAFPPRVTPPFPYGFALIPDTLDGRRRIWHNGALPGFTSHLSWYQDEQLTITVLVNFFDTENDPATEIADAIARAMK